MLTINSSIMNKVINGKLFVNGNLAGVGDTIQGGDVVRLVADDGYMVKEVRTPPEPYLGFKNSSNSWVWATVDDWIEKPLSVEIICPTLSPNTSWLNFAAGFDVNPDYVPVEPEPEPEPVPVFTFTQAHIDDFTNANAKIYIDDVLVTDGTGFFTGDVLTAKADDGYKLNSITYRSSTTGGTNYFAVAPDELTATSSLLNFGSGFNVSTEIDAPPAPVPVFTFTQAHIDDFTNANAKIYIDDVLVTDGTGFFTGDILTAKADDGYTFSEVASGGASVSYRTGSGSTIYFELGEPAKTATSDLLYFNSGFNVETIAILPDVRGYNNVYALTDDQLRDVTQSRFVVFDGLETIDYGKYIIGLIELPFEVSPDIIQGASTVKMGAYNSEISATLLKTDTIRLNLGDITVPLVKNSLLDYKNTVAILHLPYAKAINVDVDYVIGQTVNIEYVINLYDGVAVINLSSSKLGDVFLTVNVDMDISIPFANIETFPSKNDGKNISLGGDNGVKTPYFEIMRNNAILENGFFTIPIVDETLLSEQNGFIKIDEIDLKVKASKDEKEMILNTINQGVIIK